MDFFSQKKNDEYWDASTDASFSFIIYDIPWVYVLGKSQVYKFRMQTLENAWCAIS